ncbi:MAG: hypothetical protein JXB08_03440 [Bacilli bacterium]|nr:hypothetical protein [Bacilli bacterium]MBN2877100.1 hypothetical protein [Bacilli bacterium]
MSKKQIILFSVYAIHVIAIFIIIAFVSENPFLNIVLAIYLMLASSFIFFANRKKN